ncbi:MAG: CBS domain-containing protein [Deltaproteobacteria bacterium]|nr:CBS domain-containing protein [Deltaproteobacteria bacterium]
MIANDLMTGDPITVDPDTSIREARSLMWENDLRHIPVIEDGGLVGMLSDRDLRSYLPPPDPNSVVDEATNDRLRDPVSACMQSDAVTTDPEAEMDSLIDLMLEWRIGAVPVVEAGTDTLIGIVSYIDILKAVRGRS